MYTLEMSITGKAAPIDTPGFVFLQPQTVHEAVH